MSIDEIKKLLKTEFESIEFIDKSNDYDFEMIISDDDRGSMRDKYVIKSVDNSGNCRVFDDLGVFAKLHRKR